MSCWNYYVTSAFKFAFSGSSVLSLPVLIFSECVWGKTHSYLSIYLFDNFLKHNSSSCLCYIFNLIWILFVHWFYNAHFSHITRTTEGPHTVYSKTDVDSGHPHSSVYTTFGVYIGSHIHTCTVCARLILQLEWCMLIIKPENIFYPIYSVAEFFLNAFEFLYLKVSCWVFWLLWCVFIRASRRRRATRYTALRIFSTSFHLRQQKRRDCSLIQLHFLFVLRRHQPDICRQPLASVSSSPGTDWRK